MIVSLYDSKISEKQGVMFSIQSIIVTHSPKENPMKEMTCSLYLGGFLHGTNKRIAKIIAFRLHAIIALLKFQLLVYPPHILHIPTHLHQILI